MSQIGSTFCEAVYTLIEGKMAQLRFDKTVKATINKIVNLDKGEYKVRYDGNVFSAFAIDTSKKFSINDQVLVIAPDGDFSGQKFILAKTNSESIVAEQVNELANSFIPISPRFDELGYDYNYSTIYGLIAGAGSDPEHYPDEPDHIPIFNAEEQAHGNPYLSAQDNFMKYAKQYEYIKIQGSFLTQLLQQHTKGDYGLQVAFYGKEGQGELVYKLGLDSFIGTPYNFSQYSPQSIIIKIDKGYATGLKSITFYEEGFVYDKDSGGLEIHNENLFVKDITLQFVDQKDLYNTPYSLIIYTPRGITFNDQVSTIDLIGQLIYQGQDLLDSSSCSCQWYERDLHVTVGNVDYDKNAGVGWRKLAGKTTNSMTIGRDEVKTTKEYKLVVIYQNSTVCTATVKLYNSNAVYTFQILRDGNTLRLEKLSGPNNIVGDWYYANQDTNAAPVENGTKVDSIDITNYLIYSSLIFYCQVYQTGDLTTPLGVEQYQIVTNDELNANLSVIFNGPSLFRYDANGDTTIEESTLERIIEPTLVWPEGVSTSYTVQWTSLEGTAVPNEPASWLNGSMLDKVWVDGSNNLHYTIKQRYDPQATNNLFKFIVTTIDGGQYVFSKEILFLKDGDQGTNGTSYVAIIRPCNEEGVVYNTYQAVIYNDNSTLVYAPYLRCFVYKDGEPLWNNSDYKVAYTWKSYEANIAVQNNDIISISGANPGSYVKVDVKVTPNISGTAPANKTAYVYSHYPLDILNGDFSPSDFDEDGRFVEYNWPRFIKYRSNGYYPVYSTSKIDLRYDDVTLHLTPDRPDLVGLKDKADGQYLDPAPIFYFEDYYSQYNGRTATFTSQVGSAGTLHHTIFLYLDTYGNEAINGWDGEAIEIDEQGKYLLAPMIGAGEKHPEDHNTFSGVVMGKLPDNTGLRTGLYGFSHGLNTFGLQDNGIAYFGAKSNGHQIVIDGTTATISGGNCEGASAAPNGMYLQLKDDGVDGTTKAIGIGKGPNENDPENFYVRYNGTMYAHGATIDGSIDAKSFFLDGTEVLFQTGADGIVRTNLGVDAANIKNLTAQTIVATSGDIVDLTVDSLVTARKVYRYLHGLTSDINYVAISDFGSPDGAGIKFITGLCQYTEDPINATNLAGEELYWEASSAPWNDGTGYGTTWRFGEDGYPEVPVVTSGGETTWVKVNITKNSHNNSYPHVLVYKYTGDGETATSEDLKGSFLIKQDETTGVYVPRIDLGVGNQYQNDKAWICKPQGALEVMYRAGTEQGNRKDIGMRCNVDGYVDIIGQRRATRLDLSHWDSGYITATLEGNIEVSYQVTTDEQGRPTRFFDNDNSMEVTW